MFKVHYRERIKKVNQNPWSDKTLEEQVAELAEQYPDAIYFEV